MNENPDVLLLADMYHYNTWANARVFVVCGDLEATMLGEDAPGTIGTIVETLKHLVMIEEVYLAMLQGQELGSQGAQDSYVAHDLTWFASRASQLGQGYADLLATHGSALLGRDLAVPWFDFILTARDGLLQVLTHSAQHRAQIFSILGARDVKVPDLDYVFMVRDQKRLH